LLRCLIVAFVSLTLTRLNPHCNLINTFWRSQLLVFCSTIVLLVLICQPLVVTQTATPSTLSRYGGNLEPRYCYFKASSASDDAVRLFASIRCEVISPKKTVPKGI
ncbi:unnamed protein product, partial [Hymenolepis diminuta]